MYYYEGENDWMKNLSNKKLNIVRNNPLKDQLLHFMNIISGTENIKCTASDSLSSLLTIKAIRQSIEKNIPIYLADCWLKILYSYYFFKLNFKNSYNNPKNLTILKK